MATHSANSAEAHPAAACDAADCAECATERARCSFIARRASSAMNVIADVIPLITENEALDEVIRIKFGLIRIRDYFSKYMSDGNA